MRHPKWKNIDRLFPKVVENIGSPYDKRAGKTWDPGQAVCAEAYGENWNKHPLFLEWDQKDDDEAPEPTYYEAFLKIAEGHIPEWMEV